MPSPTAYNPRRLSEARVTLLGVLTYRPDLSDPERHKLENAVDAIEAIQERETKDPR